MIAFDADASSTSVSAASAHARKNHANLDLFVRELLQRIGQNLGRAAHIRLQDDVQFLGFAFLQLIVELIGACMRLVFDIATSRALASR